MWTQQIPISQTLAQDAASTFRLVEPGSSQNSYPAFHSIIGQQRAICNWGLWINTTWTKSKTMLILWKLCACRNCWAAYFLFKSQNRTHSSHTYTVYIVLLLKPPFLGGSTFAASSRLKSIVACCTTIQYPLKAIIS